MTRSYVRTNTSAKAKLMVFAFVVALMTLLAGTAVAQTPYLVKDINPSTDVGSSNPSQFVAVGTKTFFTTYVPGEGYQLWKTDGSGGGTSLVIDQYFSGISSMTASGGKLFFVVSKTALSGGIIVSGPVLGGGSFTVPSAELWTSDGTAAGTKKIRNLTLTTSSGAVLASPSSRIGQRLIADVNGSLFFASDDGSTGYALWKTDGTLEGTVMVKAMSFTVDCPEGFICFPPSYSLVPTSLVALDGTLFFVTTDKSLWKSDGTEAGTVVVKAASGFSPTNLMDVSGTLFFTSNNEFWKSDGTEAGTAPFVSMGSLTAQQVTNVNGTLFFATVESTESGPLVQLWKSDGTGPGTIPIKNICSMACISGASSWTSSSGTVTTYALGPLYFTNVNGTLFYADSGALWKSDGTTEGTVQVAADIQPASLVAFNGSLYFAGYDSVNGYELWRSDGTAGGTALVKDICPGTCSSLPIPRIPRTIPTFIEGWFNGRTNLADFLMGNAVGYYQPSYASSSQAPLITASNGKLYFTGCDLGNSCEPWTSDGTSGGTTLLKNVAIDTASEISTAADLNGTLLFSAYDGTSPKLWRTDGTEEGTTIVKAVSASIVPTAVSPDAAFFIKVGFGGGFQLWKSDGTEVGTSIVKELPAPEGATYPAYSLPSLLTVNGTLFFTANDGVHGTELWKSDGTADGTVMVKDIVPGSLGSDPVYLVRANGMLFFSGRDSSGGGSALWKSDGTEAGTVELKSFMPAENCSTSCYVPLPQSLTPVGSAVFFATDGTLWKSDGTVDGTDQVPLPTASSNAGLTGLTDVNGTLYFWRSNELCKSDGTEQGTVIVKDFTPEPSVPLGASSINVYSLNYMVNVNGTLFFVQQNALWKSNGTEEGTVKVKDISPSALTAARGLLYFVAKDANGTELWKSDGTEAGTVMVADINPGPKGSFPAILGTSRGKLYFTANDGTHGTELWALDVAPTSVTLAPSKGVAVVNASVTLTATVRSALTGTLTGSVKFRDGTTVLGTATIDASGVATLSTTSLAAGTHAISAFYAGDANFANSTSAAVNVVVLAAAPDYSLSANPNTATIRAGQSAQFVITATAGEYFDGTVTFSCGSLPRGVTCSFSPATLSPTSGHPAQTTLVVSTTSQTLAKNLPSEQSSGILLAVLGGSGVFGCLLIGRRKRLVWIALPVVALLALSLSACGGGGGSSVRPNPNGTPSGTATVIVTAAATAGSSGGNTAAHPLTLTVNVQ